MGSSLSHGWKYQGDTHIDIGAVCTLRPCLKPGPLIWTGFPLAWLDTHRDMLGLKLVSRDHFNNNKVVSLPFFFLFLLFSPSSMASLWWFIRAETTNDLNSSLTRVEMTIKHGVLDVNRENPNGIVSVGEIIKLEKKYGKYSLLGENSSFSNNSYGIPKWWDTSKGSYYYWPPGNRSVATLPDTHTRRERWPMREIHPPPNHFFDIVTLYNLIFINLTGHP